MKNNSFILKKKYFNGLYTLEKNACKGHFYNNSLYFLVVYELIEAKGFEIFKRTYMSGLHTSQVGFIVPMIRFMVGN